MIALVPRCRAVPRFCTGAGVRQPPLPRLHHDCRMHATLALAALVLLPPPWAWPVDPPSVVVRPYLAPESPFSAGHRGVDLAAPAGTLYAPADGIVHFAGTVVDRPVLSIEQSGGVITSFLPVETSLVAGDVVERGERIGTVLPGHCASVCLHFGVRLHGIYVSPLQWLGGIEHAVLLPTRYGSVSDVRERSPTVEGHGSG